MNRREFLAGLLGTGAALVVAAPARSYFFAPRGGWRPRVSVLIEYVVPTGFQIREEDLDLRPGAIIHVPTRFGEDGGFLLGVEASAGLDEMFASGKTKWVGKPRTIETRSWVLEAFRDADSGPR